MEERAERDKGRNWINGRKGRGNCYQLRERNDFRADMEKK
jgi:hypothetical protein